MSKLICCSENQVKQAGRFLHFENTNDWKTRLEFNIKKCIESHNEMPLCSQKIMKVGYFALTDILMKNLHFYCHLTALCKITLLMQVAIKSCNYTILIIHNIKKLSGNRQSVGVFSIIFASISTANFQYMSICSAGSRVGTYGGGGVEVDGVNWNSPPKT